MIATRAVFPLGAAAAPQWMRLLRQLLQPKDIIGHGPGFYLRCLLSWLILRER
jgi:hypothetical protein